jgi:manganese-dependent ADP-ribose/CDP-alcohol diphosphatase
MEWRPAKETSMPRILPVIAAALCLLFETKPATAQRPLFSIGAIADCQYADEPDVPPRLYHTAPAKLAAAIADFNRQKLAFVVHLGDFIDKDWKNFDALLPIVAGSRHPLHFVLGNHDFAVDDARKRDVPAKLGMRLRYYGFKQHGWMFLVTDGNGLSSYGWPEGSVELAHSMAMHAAHYPDKPLWDGGIDETQIRWIDARLSEADRRGMKVMIFNHFPLYPENPHNLWNAADVIAMLERHPSMKLGLDGHNHEGNYGDRSGIHYLNLKGMLDSEETAYARLDVFADHIVVRGAGRQGSYDLPLH